MENNPKIPQTIASDVTELMFNPSKKNNPKLLDQSNVMRMCILASWFRTLQSIDN